MSDQAEILRKKMAASKHPKQAKTISIISGKGGVGKSSTAINFAVELIRQHQKVLIIDLDIGMGNIDIMLGFHAKRTLIDMFNERLNIQGIIEKGPNDLAYISGGSGLNHLFTLNEEKKEFFYEQYNNLVDVYDYIIFDMGAGVTRESLFFILASDECLVITTSEPTALTDSYSMIKHIIKNKGNMPIYIVMNRCKTEKEGRKSMDQFKYIIYRFLSVEVQLMGILPEDRIVTESIIKQIPYVLMNNKSKISKSIQQMTKDYLAEPDQDKNKSKTFVQRLKSLLKER